MNATDKIKLTADGVLDILTRIFKGEGVNHVIGENAPDAWRNRTVTDVLNVEYYTYKYRPDDTKRIIDELLNASADASADASVKVVNTLAALDRSFCILSRGEIERVYSKDEDTIHLSDVSLEYWVQTSKIKLLENLIEDCNISLCGRRHQIDIDETTAYSAIIIFGTPEVTDIRQDTVCGEMAKCVVGVEMLIYPSATSYCDYTVSFSVGNGDSGITDCALPLKSIKITSSMTQRGLPHIENGRRTGSVNLANANTFLLTFDGRRGNAFIDYLTKKTLSEPDEVRDNNDIIAMKIERDGQSYTHRVIIKDHQISVEANTENETHMLSLTTK